MASFAEPGTLAEAVSRFCDAIAAIPTSSSSSEEKSKKLQELLEARADSSSDNDLSNVLQRLLEKDEVDVAERFVRCISSIDTRMIENILLSPQLLDMLKDMMNDSKRGTTKLKKGFLEIFSSLSASSSSASSSTGMVTTSLHVSILSLSISSIPDSVLGIMCSEITEKIVEKIINDKFQIENVVQHLVKLYHKHLDDNTIALRLLSCLCKIMSFSEMQFAVCKTFGVPDIFLRFLHGDDVLAVMVAMEFLTQFAKNQCGVDFLFTSNTIDWLVDLSCGEHPQGLLLGSQSIRELGNIFHALSQNGLVAPWNSVDGLKTKQFLSGITNYLSSADLNDRMAGMHALKSFITSSKEALNSMFDEETLVEIFFSNLFSMPEMKTAVLNTIANVFDSPTLAAEVDLKKKVIGNLFKALKSSTLANGLIKFTKSPTNSIKYAGFDLIRAIASDGGWGLEVLFTDQELLIYLETSTKEPDKIGQELKFSIIEAIWNNRSRSLLGDDVSNRIEVMMRRGPFYHDAQVAEPLTM